MSRRPASARGYAPLETSPAQDRVLDRLLRVAREAPDGSAALLDLDGCLFDTRWRQVHVLRELASREGLWELYRVRPEHIVGRDRVDMLQRAGVAPERARALAPRVADWYRERFLDALAHDHAMPGAATLVRELERAGLRVVYFTARTRDLRPVTLRQLEHFGFPAGVVVDKPSGDVADTAFKEATLPELGRHGDPALFLDNEPRHVNAFRGSWPRALVVFVETDHSAAPERVHDDIPWIRGFLRTGAL